MFKNIRSYSQYFLAYLLLGKAICTGMPYQIDEFERITIADEDPNSKENDASILYLRPNTTQLFTELYQHYGLLHNPETTVIERAPYLDQVGAPHPFPMQPADRAIFNHAEGILKDFHTRSGNLELFLEPGNKETFFYTGSGSAQIIYALVYAIATTFPERQFLFVEKIPFYSGHHASVALLFHYPNARWQGFKDPSEINLLPDETLIEFVTSPNNPDGVFRGPSTNAKIIFGDFVFSSSAYGNGRGYLDENLAWVRKARAAGKKLYSFNSSSKQFGKTGCRTGYIWFPMNDDFSSRIFPQFFNFISLSTIGSSTAGLSEFLDLISAFLERKDAGKKLRHDAYESLVKRHEIVAKEVLLRYPGSSIVSIHGSPALFARLSDPRFPKQSAREIIFDDIRTSVSGGVPFGETDEFFRVNLTGYSAELAELTNRLAGFQKYHPADFLIVSEQVCQKVKICGRTEQNTRYVANPNNCVILADAKQGPIEIVLPDFIDYDASHVITIKKMDHSCHQVKVISKNFTQTLTRKSNTIQVQWRQPNFLNGRWRIVHK
ncbi:MAG: aminotransferase class I/II-fold pyridoxal phosphate-dependent enzyme [Chlamydiales bacterium]